MISSAKMIEDREEYLSAIFDSTMGVLEIRPIPPKGKPRAPMFTADMAMALREIASAEKRGANCYVGIASRKPGTTHGTKDSLAKCRAVWIDFDFGDDAPADAIRFQVILDTFKLPPSMLVDSGGGRHAYWILREPVDVSTAEGQEWHEATLRGLASAWHSDRSVTDSSRIMRVPGTMNYPNEKKKAMGRIARASALLELTPNAIYDRGQFAEWTTLGQQKAVIEESSIADEGWPEPVKSALSRRSSLRRLFTYAPQSDNGWVKPTGEPNYSKFDFIIAKEMIEEGILQSDIAEACKRLRLANGGEHEKIHKPDYWLRTFNAAYGEVDEKNKKERWWYDASEGSQLKRWLLTDKLVNGEEEHPKPGFTRTPGIEVGIREIDDATGGVYGLSVLSGREGGGKTMLALMIAVSALRSGIRVIYLNAETEVDVLGERVRRQLGVSFDEMQKATSGIHWLRIRRSDDDPLSFIQRAIIPRISASDSRLLIIFDSLSSITRKLVPSKSRDFWRESQKIEEWLVDVRAASKGAIGIVAISELNKEGAEKGMTSAYAADMIVRVESDRDKKVKLIVRKTRETAQPSDVTVSLNIDRMRFETESIASALGEPVRAKSKDGKVIELHPNIGRGFEVYKDI